MTENTFKSTEKSRFVARICEGLMNVSLISVFVSEALGKCGEE
jgi:hypothetical protein